MTGPIDDSKTAVRALLSKKGPGYCFPSDAIWEFLDGSEPESLAKPGIIRRLNADGFIVGTGQMTKAVSGARKGSPTKEYTFGEAISPESLTLVNSDTAVDTEIALAACSEAVKQTGSEENDNGQYPLAKPVQRLVHGCPGSGKSFLLEQEAKAAHFVIRSVFHPESSYSDFVGGLRPQSIYKIEDSPPRFAGSTVEVLGEPYVQYVTQTGPLLNAYQLACLHPAKSVVLIIEELSRAVAAHVFGDTLQLLDRIEDNSEGLEGYSSYEIEPRPDISSWLAGNEIWNPGTNAGKMRFPPNLYLWATMNRADQNARQLDSAFLRRWSKQYLSYLTPGDFDDVEVRYGGGTVLWGELRGAINEQLKNLGGIPEDKFIGSYLLAKSRLQNSDAILEDLWGYLWNDVLKTRASTFFQSASTFAELEKMWEGGQGSPIGQLTAKPND